MAQSEDVTRTLTVTIQNQKCTIEVFRNTIVDKIIPSEILPCLVATVSTLKAKADEIRTIERTQSQKKAAELLVEQLLESRDPGWFQAFIDSLREKGYEDLVKTLVGTDAEERVNHDALYRALIDVFAPALSSIRPSELIPYLVSKGCLSDEDEEKIRRRERSDGDHQAAALLLDLIHRKSGDYFVHFMQALTENGYQAIVDEIEPAYKKTCSMEAAQNVVEQIPRIYENVQPAPSIAVVRPQVSTVAMRAAAASDMEVQEGASEREYHVQYRSEGVEVEMEVMAENRPTAMETESDVTETSNLQHFHDNMEIPTPIVDFHQNISMTNNLNAPERDVTNDTASVADNTRMLGGGAGRGQPLELRNYQLELAQDAIEGKNTVVVAPTGSGKTHVALYIAKRHLEEASVDEDAKVAFLVPTVSLVTQQSENFKKYLPSRSTVALCGEAASAKVSLGRLLPSHDVFVLTPQILVDALSGEQTEIDISSFSLLIFDECHHAVKGHPYSKVMAHYLDRKLTGGRSLPQVVGLTASVGVGKAKQLPDAVDHILKLCASLDAEKLRVVQEHRQELMSHTPQAHEDETKEVPGRIIDPFSDEINELMEMIEIRLTTDVQDKGQVIGELAKKLVAPSSRGNEQYTQWVNSLKRPIAMIRDSSMKQIVFACIRHLRMYNEALLINAECQTLDALKYIHDDMDKIKQSYPNPTEVWLENIFKEREEALRKISRDVRYSNPKLERLREKIMNYYEEDMDSRGIVFCKTRAMTEALVRWMRDTPDLEWLKPKRLVAANAPTDKGGMEQSEQDDVLRHFREGHHKIIVATSVAEEGLDIQACNFVIRYDHVTNETARIQARGRARRHGAEYALLAGEGSGTAEKDELNKIREQMMYDAIRRIVNMDVDSFEKRVKDFQKEAKQNRDMDSLGKQAQMARKRARPGGDDHSLLCMKCDEFVCFSSDIRRIQQSHHVVVDVDFKERAHVKKHHLPKEYDEMRKMGKLHCGKCDKDWGVVVRYKNVHFPVLKVSEFAVENANGCRNWYKKWKEFPFEVAALTPEEMQAIVGDSRELVAVNF